MQLANALLALGGDKGNTVPKYRLTAAEIAILQAIHGSDSVFDIVPLDEHLSVSVREEKTRLLEQYPSRDDDGALVVEAVYPGGAPIMHQKIADLQLDSSQFAVTERLAPTPVAEVKKAAPKRTTKTKAKEESKDEPAAANSADALFGDDENTDSDIMA